MNTVARMIGVLTAVALSGWASTGAAADLALWPLMPYRVRIVVAVDPEPSLGPQLEAALCESLSTRIEATIGAPWNATVSPAPPALRRAMLRNSAALSSDAASLLPAEPEVDKMVLTTVAAAGGGWTVTARDYDVRTRTLSQAVVRRVWQTGVLCDAAFDAILSAFSPLARIDRVEKNQLFLRVKASGLRPRDPNWTMVREGDVFRPILRYNDRQGNPRRVVPARWSFGVVDQASASEFRCHPFSGMRSELLTRGRGRVEALALRVVRPIGATSLALLAKGGSKTPLAGYDVFAYPPKDKAAVSWIGRTDGQGRVVIPAGDGLLRMLSIRNGNEVLARLPIVPGLEPRLTVELADDAGRLGVEGFAAGLQEELMELLVRRKILMMRIGARIEAGQFDAAADLLRELRGLPAAEQFASRIRDEEERHASADAPSREKICAMLDKARQTIDRSLDSREIDDWERRLRNAEAAPEPKNSEQRPTTK